MNINKIKSNWASILGGIIGIILGCIIFYYCFPSFSELDEIGRGMAESAVEWIKSLKL